jgi:hypothetical protein
MKKVKLIEHLEHCIDYEENWKGSRDYEGDFSYDQYDLDAREGRGRAEGYNEGYCKAMREVIALLKKEKEMNNEI